MAAAAKVHFSAPRYLLVLRDVPSISSSDVRLLFRLLFRLRLRLQLVLLLVPDNTILCNQLNPVVDNALTFLYQLCVFCLYQLKAQGAGKPFSTVSWIPCLITDAQTYVFTRRLDPLVRATQATLPATNVTPCVCKVMV